LLQNSWKVPLNINTFISVADPDPGSRSEYLFDPWIRDPGVEKVSIRIRDPDEQTRSYFLELRNPFFGIFLGVKQLKFFYDDPGSGMETVRIRDPGCKEVGSWIRDKHPGSAKLTFINKRIPKMNNFSFEERTRWATDVDEVLEILDPILEQPISQLAATFLR
jgi:hypothetical protein